jgi:hypothetical protein
MSFNPDPFAQAKAEVGNKSVGSQIAHSGLFHNVRSAFSSTGSGASKGLGLVLGVGKLFLALIPVPIVGAIVGAAADAINDKVRGARREANLAKAVLTEDQVKFEIKDLTIENLDRYRWKVKHAIEELNQGITAYNSSGQTCDDMYSFALLVEQLERRKTKLKVETAKLKKIVDLVDTWITEVETTQGPLCTTASNLVKEKARSEIALMSPLQETNPQHQAQIAAYKATHATCKKWCYFKKEVKYKPSEGWGDFKRYAGEASRFLAPIAVSAVAVRQSDYTNDSNNSSFTVSSS